MLITRWTDRLREDVGYRTCFKHKHTYANRGVQRNLKGGGRD